MPTVTYFDYDPGSGSVSGWVDYDDADVDASDSSQSLDLTDVGFIYNGEEYEFADVGSGATVEFAYGRVVGFDFSTAAVGSNPALDVTASGGTLTVDDGQNQNPFDVTIHNYDAVVLDTSESTTGATFLVTLSDGTLMQGGFTMNSSGPYYTLEDGSSTATVTEFTLTVGTATFTEEDCASTPTAHFDTSGNFVGLNYSIQNITGQAFTAITGTDGIATISYASAPAEVKAETLLEKSVTMDTSKLATGQDYRITIKVWQVGNGVGVSTDPITVNATDTTANIRDKIINALEKKKIFVFHHRGTDAITIGGRANDNDVGQSLAKIEIKAEKFNPWTSQWYFVNSLFDWQNGGLYALKPKPIGVYNGETIVIPDP